MKIVLRQSDGVIISVSEEVPAGLIGGVLESLTAPFMFGNGEYLIEVTSLPNKDIPPIFPRD